MLIHFNQSSKKLDYIEFFNNEIISKINFINLTGERVLNMELGNSNTEIFDLR